MYSNNIQGWTTYKTLYSKWIEQAKYDLTLVEVGVWLGAGIIYAAEVAKELKKNIKLYAVDTWQGSNEPEHKKRVEEMGGPDALYSKFLENVEKAGVKENISVFRGKSVDIAKIFGYNRIECDIVFLDGSHEYQDIKDDINAWLPIVKNNGILAGHDIACADVEKAVLEVLGKYDDRANDSWIYYK